MTTGTRRKPCFQCETGHLRPTDLHGETLDYRGERALRVDEHLVVPRCDVCGAMYLRAADSARLSRLLERLRAGRRRGVVLAFLDAVGRNHPQVPNSVWEELFGLSRGYLSRLAAGTRQPDPALAILLAGYASDPAAVLRLLRTTGRITPAIERALAVGP